MGAFERIDRTDAGILDLLQRDGREPYAEVGQSVGMSGPSVHEASQEARGARRDPRLLGGGGSDAARLRRSRLHLHQAGAGTISTDMTGDFVEIDEIEECHHLAGEADYLLKVRATDTRHLERVLHAIQQVPHVFTTQTQMVFSSAFERRPLRLVREVEPPTNSSGS